jgi:Family of unknown function (DUF5994)
VRTTTAERTTVTSHSAPSVLRLRLEPTLSRRTLLDGGWWPRSTDPVAELPGLILALDDRRGCVTRVMLGPAGWDSQPRRLGVAGRVVRLGWFTTQPAGLLTAICANRERVDLLVVPPDTGAADARAAMALAARAANTIHAPDILSSVTDRRAPQAETASETAWESEGGHLRGSGI